MKAAAATLGARSPATLGAASLACLAALLAAALCALVLGLALGVPSREPHDAIRDSPGEVAALFLHNLYVAGIPLALAALGWDRMPRLGVVGDALVALSLLANGAVVGWALARAGAQLLAYLPHLPLEWAGIAVAAGAWLRLRLAEPPERRALLLRGLLLSAAALLFAAAVEVYAAPLG
jgi:hypothetical protein